MRQQHACLAVAALLVCAAQVAFGARHCFTTIESSSPMFGTPWRKSFVTYSQESQWKRHGDMVKLNVYFDEGTGCVTGLKPTYGTVNSMAVRLGTEKTPEKVPVNTKHIQLGAREKITGAHWKAGKCIEYLKFSTNEGRYLEVGDRNAAAPLKSNKPAVGAFLGFFKGFTDTINTNAATGALQQVQLFWCLRECDDAPPKRDTDGNVITEAGPSDGAATEGAEPSGAAAEGSAGGGAGGEGKKQQGKKQGGKPGKGGKPGEEEDLLRGGAKPDGTYNGLLDVNGTADGGSGADNDGWISKKKNITFAKGGAGNGSSGDAWALGGGGGGNGTAVFANKGAKKNALQAMKQHLQKKKQKLFGAKFNASADGNGSAAVGWGGQLGGNASADANCSLAAACPDGVCPTPSCALNGAGKDVLTMMCYGTNIIPNPLLEATIGNPCTNLACKLDHPNCTTAPMGLGGFCTGRVVAMGRTARLHPAGEMWLGYPCLEHKGPLLALLPPMHGGDYDANGTYVGKAWKVCDCIAGFGLRKGPFALDLPDALEEKLNVTAALISGFLESKVQKLRLSPVVEKITEVVDGINEALSMVELSISLPAKEHIGLKGLLPSVTLTNVTELPVMQQGVLGMSLPDVVAQWATAFATKAHLKKYVISQSKLNALRAFVPGFELPCILVANVSAPLMRANGGAATELPVLTIPDDALPSVATLLPNITALPVLCLPKALGGAALLNATAGLAQHVSLQNFTIPSMGRVVERLLSVFPPPEWAVNIINGKFAEVASKWMTGVLVDEPIPVVNATSEQTAGLAGLLPGLNHSAPTLVLWNASSLLFTKPRLDKGLATLMVPSELAGNVSAVCPLLTPGLPALLLPHGLAAAGGNGSVPALTLGAVTPPDLKIIIDRLLSSLPGHPAFNVTLPGGGAGGGGLLGLPLQHMAAKFGSLLAGLNVSVADAGAGAYPGAGGGMGSVLDAFAGFEALKKNLTGLAGLKNISVDPDQAFVKVLANNFTGIKLIPGNFSAMLEGVAAAKAAKKEEGLAALKHLLGPKINVLKAGKQKKAKILNITVSP